MLKRLGASQKEMQRYVTRQERGFLRLRQDIERNRLQKGIPKNIVTKKYCEPVFCSATEDQILQSCLYRSPTEYFSADKVYLYFDRQESLHSWKFEPADN